MVSPGIASTRSPSTSRMMFVAVVIVTVPSCVFRALTPAQSRRSRRPCRGDCRVARSSWPHVLEFDFDESILKGVGVDDIMVHPGRARVGHALGQLGETLLTLRGHDLQPTAEERHHHIIELVHMLAGLRAWGEAPLGHAHALIVDLHRRHGLEQLHHRRSSGKKRNTERTGLGAAWPKPQIEASAIT